MASVWFVDISQTTGVKYMDFSDVSTHAAFIYANTCKLSDYASRNYIVEFKNNEKIVCVRVNPMCSDKFSGKIKDNMGGVISQIEYTPDLIDGVDTDKERSEKLINCNSSFALLRANPKLTGNVKIVVTSNGSMFLDTFKVSDSLSQYKYRHIKINPEEYYGRTLMSKFGSMPTTDFYKIKESCYNIFTTVQDYKSQYYDTYNYGVRTNGDKLYTENFAMLAPLCIKSTMPDFFLIFKVNTSDYTQALMSESEKIKYFISKGKLVKSFDMREGSDLGKYIRKINEHASKYAGDGFVSYDSNNYNKVIGISLEKGVVTLNYESVFDELDTNNQVGMNNYYTLGFERNKLVSKNIVNFEFMFNDTEEKLFSLNTYFGVYVKLNSEINDFSCIGYDETEGKYIYDSSIHSFPSGTDLGEDGDYSTYIYGVSTPYDFIRLREPLIESDVNKDFSLKPYKNILNGRVAADETESGTSTLIVDVKQPLDVGDHIRVINPTYKTIYEILCSNYDEYINDASVGYHIVNYYDSSDGSRWVLNRTNIYIPFRASLDESVYESVCEEEALKIKKAFDKISSKSNTTRVSGNRISIISSDSDAIFERISSDIGYNYEQKELLKQNKYENTVLMFFGSVYPDIMLLDLDKKTIGGYDWRESEMFYLYPIHFELLGMRSAVACKFIPNIPSNGNKIYNIETSLIKNIDTGTILYKKYDGGEETYTVYNGYDITTFASDSSAKIISKHTNIRYAPAYKLNGTHMINISDPVIIGDMISMYSAYPINTGLCSILNIKDFDFDVLDTDNNLQYRDAQVIGYEGEYSVKSVFEKVIRNTEEEDVKDYLDCRRSYHNTKSGITTDASRNEFFYNLVKNNHTKSDISMISPYCCKWKANGTDARGENLRIMYDYISLLDTSSYYIPYDISTNISVMRDYTENVGYGACENSPFRKYTAHGLNSIISSGTESQQGTLYKKDIIYGNGKIDDILYSKENYSNKESSVYPAGNNSIEFISCGIKFRITSLNDDVINFNTYNGFTASFLSVPSTNMDYATATELIIDETSKQILLVWYQSRGNKMQSNPLAYRIFHTSPMNECRCIRTSTVADAIVTPRNAEKTQMGKENTMFLVSDKFSGNANSYTKFENVIITSIIPDASILYDTVEDSYTTIDPRIYYDNETGDVTDGLINRYSSGYYNTNEMFVAGNSNISASNNGYRTLSDLTSDIQNCGLFVKKTSGGKDYTNLTNTITISIIPPFVCSENPTDKKGNTGYVHSCYVEPVMRDMLSFDYVTDASVSEIFARNFNGANIKISSANLINQLWINKYTEMTNYCIPATDDTNGNGMYRTSLDVLHNISMMDGCWSENVYRKYYISDNKERWDGLYGYMTGYEINRFINSRSINLNSYEGKSINLGKWRNTKISVREKYIRLNITDSLVYHILFTEGYVNNWRNIKITNNTYKINYIKNSILPHIHIDEYVKVGIWKQPENIGLSVQSAPDDTSSLINVSSTKHTLLYENGKYYMMIYPAETDMCAHYIKMEINL